MASLRILHASDLHISEFEKLRSPIDHFKDLNNPYSLSASEIAAKIRTVAALREEVRRRMASSYSSEPLLALSEFIYENAGRKVTGGGREVEETGDKLDAVILTGDLATTGELEDIEMAALFLRANFNPRIPYKASENEYRGATLSALRIPIILLPGNHDRYEETSSWKGNYPILFNPGGTNFDQFILNYAAQKKPIHQAVLATAITKSSNLKVIVLCADFTLQNIDDHEGRLGRLAQGVVYSDIRDRLVAKTKSVNSKKAEGEALCILWAIHFPAYYPSVKKHSRLLREESLIESANKLGVNAILAGHTHQQLEYRRPGMNSEGFCCGTTTQYEPQALPGGSQQNNVLAGNHFQILTITADQTLGVNITAQHYRYFGTTADEGPSLYDWQAVP